MQWVIARYPADWRDLAVELHRRQLSEKDVEAAFEKVLGRSVYAIEDEWRDWARAGSPIGEVTER